MVQEAEKYEVVIKDARGEVVDTVHGENWAGHSLGDHTTLIVIGGVTALVYGAMVHSAVDEIPAVRMYCLRLLDQNRLLSEALSRVQGRCTDLLMEKRALRGGIKNLISLLNIRIEAPDDIDASIITDICDSLSDLVK